MFNSLAEEFDTKVCLSYRNLRSQTFDYEKIERQFNFKPEYLKKRFVIKNRVICRGYWKAIKEFSPDIIISSEFGIDSLAALSYRSLHNSNFKIVSICDDSMDMLVNNNDFSKIHRFLRNRITPHLDNLILVEPDSAKWYNSHFNKGVYFPIVSKESRTLDNYSKAHGLSNDFIDRFCLSGKKVFLFVGRIVAIKNVDGLVKAFAKAKIPDSTLIVVGDGPERNVIENEVTGLDADIRFTGRLEGADLYAWYNIAGCFVLPSFKEPFGAVTNEALLGGAKAVVSSKAGSNCLIENGVNGYVFDPDDINALPETLTRISNEIKAVSKIESLRPSMMLKGYDEYFLPVKKMLNNL